MKYDLPFDQEQVLPNIPGFKSTEEVALSEFEGFLKAEILFTEKLSAKTKFNVVYILKIHKTALSHLYSFAGKYRDVNMSKGGFPFAAARYLPQTMQVFEEDILSQLHLTYQNKEQLINDIASVHAELLFIHPFREGNGRTARILANLMCRKQGFPALRFELITEKEFDNYVAAIQQAKNKDYSKMGEMIRFIFPA